VVGFRLGRQGVREADSHPEGKALGALRERTAAGDSEVSGFPWGERREGKFPLPGFSAVVCVIEADDGGGEGDVAVVFYVEDGIA